MNISFSETGPKLSEEILRELEAQLTATLPLDYRKFLKKMNGGIPYPSYFQLIIDGIPETAWVDRFYVIDEYLAVPSSKAHTNSLSWAMSLDLGELLPDDCIPIGSASNDDTLVLFLSGTKRGQVHLVYEPAIDEEGSPPLRRADIENAIYIVAPSFDALIQRLDHNMEQLD